MPIFATMGSLYLVFTSLLVFAIFDCHGSLVEKEDVSISEADPVALQPKYAVGCPRIISRSEWGARSPKATSNLVTPLPYAVVHHTDGSPCSTEASCKSQVRGIQNYHMDSNGWSDIGYNFLIGGDGNVYEGRGWNYKGAHASSYNSYSLGISMIGRFTSSAPGQEMLDVLDELLNCALSRDTIIPGYSLFGHRQATSTTCPGDALYNKLQQHKHYVYISGSVGNPLDGEQCSL